MAEDNGRKPKTEKCADSGRSSHGRGPLLLTQRGAQSGVIGPWDSSAVPSGARIRAGFGLLQLFDLLERETVPDLSDLLDRIKIKYLKLINRRV